MAKLDTKPTRKKAKSPKNNGQSSNRGKRLTLQQEEFVHELIADERMVAWKAYQRVYRVSSKKVCEAASSRLLSLVKVKQALEVAKEQRLTRVKFSQDQMFNRLLSMALADPNDIIEYRRENCRHCNGIDHKFQWVDQSEFERACNEAVNNLEPGQIPVMPSDDGGYGFDAKGDPHPDCPNCKGDGYGHPHIHDTRFLRGGAAKLYAGVKETQNGIEVKMHDQLAISKLIMQHMGMLDPKLTIKGDKENPLVALLESLPGSTLKPVDEGED